MKTSYKVLLLKKFALAVIKWGSKKEEELAANPRAMDPVNRPVEFHPGDYSHQNRLMIQGMSSIAIWERLWLEECRDSLNPIRSAEAASIAKHFKSGREEAIAFYSRWHIEP